MSHASKVGLRLSCIKVKASNAALLLPSSKVGGHEHDLAEWRVEKRVREDEQQRETSPMTAVPYHVLKDDFRLFVVSSSRKAWKDILRRL